MRLYSLQGYDLRTFAGPIRRGVGQYSNLAEYPDAQSRLLAHLQEHQLVWFSQQPVKAFSNHLGCFVHEADVPESEFFAIINAFVWTNVVTPGWYVPPEIEERLESSGQWQGAEHYIAEKFPTDWLSAVKASTITSIDDQILVRFPIPKAVTFVRVQKVVSATRGGTGILEDVSP